MESAVETGAAPGLDLTRPPIPHPKGRAMHEPDKYLSIFLFNPVLIGNSRRWRNLPVFTTVPVATAKRSSVATVTGATSTAVNPVQI